jgi:hypothetical protein
MVSEMVSTARATTRGATCAGSGRAGNRPRVRRLRLSGQRARHSRNRRGSACGTRSRTGSRCVGPRPVRSSDRRPCRGDDRYTLVKEDGELSWCAIGAGRMLRAPTVFEGVVKTR